jgi:hypothetical protein
MVERDDDIEKIFRERFSKDKAPVGDHVWKNLQQHIPAEDSDPKFKGWWWFLAATVITIGISFLLFKYTINDNSQNQSIADTEKAGKDLGVDSLQFKENKDLLTQHQQTNEDAYLSQTETLSRNNNQYQGNKNNEVDAQNTQEKVNQHVLDNQNQLKGNSVVKNTSKKVKTNSNASNKDLNTKDNKATLNRNSGNLISDVDVKNQNNLNVDQPNLNKKDNQITPDNNPKGLNSNNESKVAGKVNDEHSEIDQKIINQNTALVDQGNKDKKEDKDEQLLDTKEKPVKSDATDGLEKKSALVDKGIKVNGNVINNGSIENKNSHAKLDENNKIETVAKNNVANMKEDSTLVSQDSTIAKVDTKEAPDSSNAKKKRNAAKNWSLDVFAGPGLSLPSTKETPGLPDNSKVTNSAKVVLPIGLGISYSINDKFSLSTGLSYKSQASKFSHVLTQYTLDSTMEIVMKQDSMGLTYDTIYNQHTNKVEYSQHRKNQWTYLEIPIWISYSTNFGKLKAEWMLGLSANVLLKAKEHYPDSTGTTINMIDFSKDPDRFRKLVLTGMGGARFMYGLNEHWSVFAQPTVAVPFNKVYKTDNPVNHRISSFELRLGLRYKF